jgi:hypothetical protein
MRSQLSREADSASPAAETCGCSSRREQFLVNPYTAALLRRAGQATVKAGRQRCSELWPNLFQRQQMLPAVAEVVFVREQVARHGQHLIHPEGCLQHPVLVISLVEGSPP